ncbi:MULTISPECIES: hypothetical protein, partial [Klebsiella]
IGPDPRNFNQRVSLGRNDLLIRTFLRNPICNRWRFSSMLLADLAKTAYGPFCFAWKMRKVSAFAGKFEREM